MKSDQESILSNYNPMNRTLMVKSPDHFAICHCHNCTFFDIPDYKKTVLRFNSPFSCCACNGANPATTQTNGTC